VGIIGLAGKIRSCAAFREKMRQIFSCEANTPSVSTALRTRLRPVIPMMTRASAAVALLSTGALAQEACETRADASEICDLGTLPLETASAAQGVSGDGTVVVGGLLDDGDSEPAFRWDESAGLAALTLLPGATTSVARGVNADGSVIVGTSFDGTTRSAVRWVEGAGVSSLGTLVGGGDSEATAVNADGSKIAGFALDSSGYRRAFRWSEGTGLENLGTLAGGDASWARAIDADGGVIVGGASVPSSVIGGTSHAFRWLEGSGMTDLGVLDGLDWSEAYGVNADGSVVVGQSQSLEGYRAFRWVAGSGMTDLGTLSGGSESTATAVSADGSVVVGQSDDTSGALYAFRWASGTGMESLGTLTGGSWSTATDVSDDGTIVVGTSGSSAGDRAFIWRASDTGGTLEDLANLEVSIETLAQDNSQATSKQQGALIQVVLVPETLVIQPPQVVSALISTTQSATTLVATEKQTAPISTATGARLDDYYEIGEPTEVSDAKRAYSQAITNTNAGLDELQAAIATLAAASNLPPSAQKKAAETVATAALKEATAKYHSLLAEERAERAKLTDHQANMVQEYLKRTSNIRASSSNHGRVDFSNRGTRFVSLRTSLGRSPAQSATSGASTTTVAGLTYGQGVSNRLTLGFSVDLQHQKVQDNAFDMKTNAMLGLWGQYSASAGAGTGLQVSGGLGYTRAEGEVTRGRLLTDVIPAAGETSLTTRVARIEIGYGVMAGPGLRLTPSVGLAHYNTRRAAYTETGAAFNASYDAQETERTTLSLGLRGEKGIGAQDLVSFGFGMETDLHAEAERMTGTSTLPGLTSFDIVSPQDRNRSRPFVNIGYTHRAGNGESFAIEAAASRAETGSKPDLVVNLAYSKAF